MHISTNIKAAELIEEAFGYDIAELRQDPTVTDIVMNNDGSVFAMRSGSWLDTGLIMDEPAKLWAINALGHLQNRIVDHEAPNLEATIPGSGDRVQAMVPTTSVDGSTIAIRIPSTRRFRIEDFPEVKLSAVKLDTDRIDDVMELPASGTGRKWAAIRWAVKHRANLMLIGQTGSAKTSLAKAITEEPDFTCDRAVLIEDRPELPLFGVKNKFVWWEGVLPSRKLVQAGMRSMPDRIIFGEFREGGSCDEYFKACRTGHRGNMSTVHANDAYEAVQRVLDLLREVHGHEPHPRMVVPYMGLIIHMAREEGVRGIVGVYHPVMKPDGTYEVIEIA